MKKMKTQMMIKCKNNKTEISRLWLPEILLKIWIDMERKQMYYIEHGKCGHMEIWKYGNMEKQVIWN